MSLLDTASLIVTPNGYKEGKLYSVIPSDGSGDMSVVRATTATRVNSAGLVELVPYNLIRRSEEFNLIWSPVRSSITANSTTAPNGTLTADTLIDDTNNNIHYIAQTFTAINGAATISVYAKANQISQIQLVAQQGTTPMGRGFDLATGTVFTESVGGVSSNDLGQSITDVGNGWYRCEMSWTSTGQNEFWILLSVSNAATFTGTGANGVYIWGAQVVEGSTALPYQKTETRLNIPRLDYSNGTCPSLLVEPQRTNLQTYSEDISQTQYNKVRCTVSANSVVSPSGYTNADKIIQDSANTSWGGVNQVYSPTAPATLSVFAKKIDNDYIAIIGHSVNPTAAWFNLANGTVGTTEVNVTSASIVDYGNGWYRCSITATTVNRFTVLHASSNGGNTAPVNSETALWGFQLEASSSYPTSYIPTTSATVTRNADVISKTGISSLIGQTEGTLFVDVDFTHTNKGSNEYLAQIWSSNVTRILLYRSSVSGQIGVIIIQSSSTIYSFLSTVNTNERHKVAFAYKSGDIAFYIDGSSVSTSSSSFSPFSSLQNYDLGIHTASGTPIEIGDYSYNASALWKTRLTNDELERLTTI
jgi:hypothetical protein